MPELPRIQLRLRRPSLRWTPRSVIREPSLYGLALGLISVAGWLAGANPLAIVAMLLVFGLALLPATSAGATYLERLGRTEAFGAIVAVIATVVTFVAFILAEGLGTRVALVPWFSFMVYLLPFLIVQLGNRNPRRLNPTARDYAVVLIAIVLLSPLVQIPLFESSDPTYFAFTPFVLLGAVFIPASLLLAVRDKPPLRCGFVLRLSTVDLIWAVGGALLILLLLVPIRVGLGATLHLPAAPTAIIISLVYSTLVLALAEEYVFRGLLLGLLTESLPRRPYATVIALVGSSLVFAMVRALSLPHPYLVAGAFVSGLVLGLLYLRTGRLTAPILANGLVGLIGATLLTG